MELPKPFQRMLFSTKVPHALLLTGPVEAQLEKVAVAFAEELFCRSSSQADQVRSKIRSGNHPDLHIYRPEGKTGMHSIQSLRSLSQETTFVPYEASYKCFILCDAERMLPTSSNALLKTLEEPPPQTLLMLLSSFPEHVLPTLLSRCQRCSLGTSSSPLLDSFQEHLLTQLPEGMTLAVAQELGVQLDQMRKEWEKELRKALSTDHSSVQKEAVEKELEGILTLRTQEKIRTLFQGILYWYRDRWLLQLELLDDLFYPSRIEQLRRTPVLPLPTVEKVLAQAQLGIERGIKLQTCLEVLFIQLSQPHLRY